MKLVLTVMKDVMDESVPDMLKKIPSDEAADQIIAFMKEQSEMANKLSEIFRSINLNEVADVIDQSALLNGIQTVTSKDDVHTKNEGISLF